MSYSNLIWLAIAGDRPTAPSAGRSPKRRRHAAGLAVALAAAAAGLAVPAVSQAAPLSLAQARAEATAAVAPLTVDRVVCLRDMGERGRAARRRAACIVAHPSADDSLCRSFVVITAPRGRVSAARPIRARVAGLNLCLSLASSSEAGR